jgi:hypothetical protein
MLFNPTPIAHALAQQSRMNTELAAREAERDRRQSEWNALHYEILQRLAVEVSRTSIEAQSLSLRVESLAAKVDFNERRVRTMEGAQAQVRSPRPAEIGQPAQAGRSAAPAGTGRGSIRRCPATTSPTSPRPSRSNHRRACRRQRDGCTVAN